MRSFANIRIVKPGNDKKNIVKLHVGLIMCLYTFHSTMAPRKKIPGFSVRLRLSMSNPKRVGCLCATNGCLSSMATSKLVGSSILACHQKLVSGYHRYRELCLFSLSLFLVDRMGTKCTPCDQGSKRPWKVLSSEVVPRNGLPLILKVLEFLLLDLNKCLIFIPMSDLNSFQRPNASVPAESKKTFEHDVWWTIVHVHV